MERTRLELTDFMRYVSLINLLGSPEGRYAAMLAVQCDSGQNAYKKTLWLYDLPGGRLRSLSAPCPVNSFIWDGPEDILIPEPSAGLTRFFRLNVSRNIAEEAFCLPGKVDKILRLGGGRYAAIVKDDLAEPDSLLHKDYEIFEDLPIRQNAGGYVSRIRKHLYLAEPEQGRFECISPRFFDTEALCCTPDGRLLVYAGREYTDMRMLHHSIRLYDPQTGESVPVLEQEEGMFFGFMDCDADSIFYTATDMKPHGFGQNKDIYRYDLRSGKKVLAAKYDRNAGSTDIVTDVRYAPASMFRVHQGSLYFCTTDGFDEHIRCCDSEGRIRNIFSARGDISGFCIANNEIFCILMDGLNLQELYRFPLAGGNPERLSAFNEDIFSAKTLSEPEHFVFTNRDNISLDGWVIKPVDFREDRRYPAILDIHGGPRMVYGRVFVHEMQYWANQGYFVMFSNPRGGSGRGDDFTDMFLEHKLGEWDFNDLMDFTDTVLERYPAIDPERLGVTGGSYGGFMTNWILGHTKRFAAAASQRSISDWFSNTLVSDNGYFDWNRLAEKDVWTEYDRLWEQSPVRYAPSVTTPTLFIHSFEDYRCPFGQGLEMFTALKMNGLETRMVAFYQENHELSRAGKPSNRVKRLSEITRWLDMHLKAKKE
jgi:dipeptidyl aminopeptidase/acylaminoacyl peptidase